MQIVLTEDIPNLGQKFDIVNVKTGYFRNYLFPQGKAHMFTKGRQREVEKYQEKRVLKKEQIEEQAEKIQKILEGLTLTFERKTTSKGKLYGSISENNILKALEDKAKIHLEKENIIMEHHLKEVGEHEVGIKLSDTITSSVKIKIEGIE